MSIYGAIFDLDGTIISDEEVYADAFSHVLQSLGTSTPRKYPHKGGIGVAENWPYLLNKHKIKTEKTIAQLTALTQKYFLEHINEVDIRDGFAEFAGVLRENAIATALATSNEWFVVEAIFDELSLPSYFDCIVTGEEAPKKPDPGLFLLAASKLSIDPADCVVFEDSEAGVIAGRRAGMKVVGIARSQTHQKELAGADYIVLGFTDIMVSIGKLIAK